MNPYEPCKACGEQVIYGASECPQCRASIAVRASQRLGKAEIVTGMLIVAAALTHHFVKDGDDHVQGAHAQATSTAPASKPERPCSKPCTVRMEEGSDAEVPVFPTEAGLEEFGDAVASRNRKAFGVAFAANDGFFISAGTECLRLSGVFSTAKIRLLDGPHAGRIGYVPFDWLDRCKATP